METFWYKHSVINTYYTQRRLERAAALAAVGPLNCEVTISLPWLTSSRKAGSWPQ